MKGATSWHSYRKRESEHPSSFLSCPSFPQFTTKGWPLFRIRRSSQLLPPFALYPIYVGFHYDLSTANCESLCTESLCVAPCLRRTLLTTGSFPRDDRGKHPLPLLVSRENVMRIDSSFWRELCAHEHQRISWQLQLVLFPWKRREKVRGISKPLHILMTGVRKITSDSCNYWNIDIVSKM